MKKNIIIGLILVLVLNLGAGFTETTTGSGADQLYKHGFIAGDKGNLMEEKTFTRAEACVVLAEMYGLKTDASKMVYINYFSDVKNTDWYAPYVTFAKSKGWINGYPEGTFKPGNSVTQQEWSTMIMKVLGYDFTWATVNLDAKTVGFNINKELSDKLNRGEAFEVMWQAVNTPRKGEIKSLGQEIGKIEYQAPEVVPPVVQPDVEVVDQPLIAVATKAESLKQIHIKFNQPLDSEKAEDITKYSLINENAKTVTIIDSAFNASTYEVVLTLKEVQQLNSKLTLNVSEMTAPKGTKIDDLKGEIINMVDVTVPVVLSAEMIANNRFKVYFSEPIQGDEDINPSSDADTLNELNTGDIKFDTTKIFAKSITLDALGQVATVETYGNITADFSFMFLPVVKDFYGYKVVMTNLLVKYTQDVTPPEVVGYRATSNTGVVLIFNEEIKLSNGLSDQYYHGVGNTSDAALSGQNINKNELTLFFSKRPLVYGENDVYIKAEAISDLWGNKTRAISTKVLVEEDLTVPELKSLVVKNEKQIEISITKVLDNSTKSVVDPKNYKIYNAENVSVDNLIKTVEYNNTQGKITITFKENLSGDYKITASNLVDFGKKPLTLSSYVFNVADYTKPNPALWTAKYFSLPDGSKMVKIKFDEKMRASGDYSISKIENYSINGTALFTLEKNVVGLAVVENDTSVEITIKDAAHGGIDIYTDGDGILNSSKDVVIARVADVSGNSTDGFVNIVDLKDKGKISLVSAELFDAQLVKLVFSDVIEKFDAADLQVVENSKDIGIANYSIITNDELKTEVILELKSEVSTNPESLKVKVIGEISSNRFGEPLEKNTSILVTDKLGPKVSIIKIKETITEDVTFEKARGLIRIVMTEAIKPSTVTNDSFSVDGARIDRIALIDNIIYIYIESDDQNNIEVGTRVTQLTAIEDAKGNQVNGLYLSVQELK